MNNENLRAKATALNNVAKHEMREVRQLILALTAFT